jgi:hypothetical protein
MRHAATASRVFGVSSSPSRLRNRDRRPRGASRQGSTSRSGDERTRTADPLLAKQVLYQLSYVPARRPATSTASGRASSLSVVTPATPRPNAAPSGTTTASTAERRRARGRAERPPPLLPASPRQPIATARFPTAETTRGNGLRPVELLRREAPPPRTTPTVRRRSGRPTRSAPAPSPAARRPATFARRRRRCAAAGRRAATRSTTATGRAPRAVPRRP